MFLTATLLTPPPPPNQVSPAEVPVATLALSCLLPDNQITSYQVSFCSMILMTSTRLQQTPKTCTHLKLTTATNHENAFSHENAYAWGPGNQGLETPLDSQQ